MKIELKKIIMCFGVVTSLLVLLPLNSQAFEGDARGCWRGQRAQRAGGLMAELDLTPSQREEMMEYRKESLERKKEIAQRLRDKRRELKEELGKTFSNKRKITKIVSAIKELQGRLMDNTVEDFLRMKEILTPEQFRKFLDFSDQKMRRGPQAGRGQRMP